MAPILIPDNLTNVVYTASPPGSVTLDSAVASATNARGLLDILNGIQEHKNSYCK
jgi:hypothetical protein